MISALFVANFKGDTLISRLYRDDVTPRVSDAFRVHIVHSRTPIRSPINNINRTTYMHVKRNNLWIVAATRQNANAALVFELLGKFIALCESYFDKFTELNVKNNFALVYELLDEVIDYGVVQLTDADALKALVTQSGLVVNSLAEQEKITSAVTGAIGWRRDGIKYRKQEIYLDLLETVHALVSPSGQTLSAHVSGAIRMKAYMSGMPECKLGINDKLHQIDKAPKPTAGKGKRKPVQAIAIDDLTFHQCVKLAKFDTDRSISFIPPDGDFELLRYRSTQDVLLPFRVTPMVQEYGDKFNIAVTIKAEYSPEREGTKIEVVIPVPTSTANVTVSTDRGKAKYKPALNAVVWKLRNMLGGKTAKIQADVSLLSTMSKKTWTRPPISVSFEVPFACSGLEIKYLRALEPKLGYDDSAVKKWIRSIARSGAGSNGGSSYEFRY